MKFTVRLTSDVYGIVITPPVSNQGPNAVANCIGLKTNTGESITTLSHPLVRRYPALSTGYSWITNQNANKKNQ